MGLYDQQPISMATNSAAQRYYSRYGQMPNRTVGGLYGGAMPSPDNVPTSQQTLGYATGNQYAPMRQPGLDMAPTTQAGYQQQMAQQNPGGGLFGGALPAYGTSSGGATRPMWMGAPAEPSANNNFPSYADWNKARGGPSNRPLTMDQQRGLAAGHAQYIQGRNQQLANRQGLVQQNSMNRSNARRAGLGIGDPLDMAMRGNPEIAGMMGMGQLGLQGQQMQYGLAAAGMAQRAQQQHLQNLTGLAGAIGQMDIPPGEKQKYMAQIMQAHGLQMPGGGQQGGQPGGGLMGQQRVDYMIPKEVQSKLMGAKTPQEKEQILNEHGITDIGTRQQVLGVGRNAPPPGLGDWAQWGVAQTTPLGWLGLNPMPGTQPQNYTPMQRFGLQLPQVGPRKGPGKSRFPQSSGASGSY